MADDLSQRKIAITGASSGIGEAIALAAAVAAGAAVALGARRAARIEALAGRIEDEAHERLGGLDALVRDRCARAGAATS